MTATRLQDVLHEQIADELLLLSPANVEAHALNASAAAVYALCDGRHAKAEMAAAVRQRTGLPADDTVVDLALAELRDARLVTVDEAGWQAPASRRLVGRSLQLTPDQARQLPSVETVLLPMPQAEPLNAARKPDVRFVPIGEDAIDETLALAQVKPTDLVFELGCGDARLLVAAALRHGCRGLGVDIDPSRVADAVANVRRHGLGDRVRIEERDMFQVDLGPADVVLLYTLPTLNVRLLPRLTTLKAGARVVSYDFDMAGVVPDRAVQVYAPATQIAKTYFLWIAPLKHAAQYTVRRQWTQSSPIG